MDSYTSSFAELLNHARDTEQFKSPTLDNKQPIPLYILYKTRAYHRRVSQKALDNLETSSIRYHVTVIEHQDISKTIAQHVVNPQNQTRKLRIFFLYNTNKKFRLTGSTPEQEPV